VIRDYSPNGGSKYVVVANSSDGKKRKLKRGDPGSTSNDASNYAPLQADIDDYFRRKNLQEFEELDEMNERMRCIEVK
jgi:hypothetical protein